MVMLGVLGAMTAPRCSRFFTFCVPPRPSLPATSAELPRNTVGLSAGTDNSENVEEKPQRAPLSSLAERFGLLGLVVGLAFAFSDVFLGADVGLESLLGSVGVLVRSLLSLATNAPEMAADMIPPPAEMEGEFQTSVGVAAGALSAVPGIVGNIDVVETEQDIASAAGSAEAVGEAAVAFGQILVRAGVAGSFGAVGSYSGLLAEGAQEPYRQRKRKRFLNPSEFTPGTMRQALDGEEDEWEPQPMAAWRIGTKTFAREWKELLRAARSANLAPRRHVPDFVFSLVLSNEAVKVREDARPEVPAPGPVRVAYDVLCWFIDVIFEDRPIQRFWFLETVARMPYFAYTSVLHLYETLGWWRSPELRQVHIAEENNELHHLLIMESLGGDQRWLDRFFAQHGAFFYYWILVCFFVIDPRWSYNFSRLIEAHAVDTYGEFADANEERLRMLPPPPIAVEYYLAGDLYLFDKFQTARRNQPRRPPCATLFDVFTNIRDDEEQHVLTMAACEEWANGGEPAVTVDISTIDPEEYRRKVLETPDGRAAWEAWAREVNAQE